MSAIDTTDEIEPWLDCEVRAGVLEDLEAKAVPGAGRTVVYDGKESLEPRHGNFGLWTLVGSGMEMRLWIAMA